MGLEIVGLEIVGLEIRESIHRQSRAQGGTAEHGRSTGEQGAGVAFHLAQSISLDQSYISTEDWTNISFQSSKCSKSAIFKTLVNQQGVASGLLIPRAG